MALLQKLKELLGIGGGDERSERGDTEVTVERDPEPEVVGEAGEDEAPEDIETDEAPEDDEEAVGEESEEEQPDADDDKDDDGEDESGEEPATEPDEDGEPVQNIKGIGPAYAERLEGIGITTVTQLAAADPEAVAEEAKIGEGRASTWIERANERQ
ncbi:hypothetical protein AArcSl_0590 [Halalkaliarchaeum desulfuricum]|uniref:Helix-hairpin-helix domain-containing protein n=1 Tax=Halalkaliarchaeum desulfuricum TaxID=2055893 RepID=A0A343TGL8_9EURY|nr:helix-hairpin-helix domain-containing protein [Halalkaliarchaeum desulfuricum]AUX08240.1 hypothetical protein AArcSl_0590 [Halalkaliarchaeum desulfuricum]